MRYFDLHCDTMTECAVKDIPLRENTLHVSLEQVKDWEHYVQCYAVWLPDDLRGKAAWQRFLQVAERFAREVGENAGSLEQLRGPGGWNARGVTEPSSRWRAGRCWAASWSASKSASDWAWGCAP